MFFEFVIQKTSNQPLCRSPSLCVTHFFLRYSEMLAWASAQIHCQFHTSEHRVALPTRGNKQDVQAESDTVLIPSRGEQDTREPKNTNSVALT